jgi:hypothetical protein
MFVMREDEWVHFFASGDPPIVAVTRLPTFLCDQIGAVTNLVRMKHPYALKALHKHNVEPHRLAMLPLTIDLGRAVKDRANALTFFFYENSIYGSWHHASVKTCANGTELWVSTFHYSDPEEIDRKCRKHGILRPEII